MPVNGPKLRLFIKLAVIVIGFTFSIAACYAWLLPTSFHVHKNYYVLFSGLFGAYITAGSVGYNFLAGATLFKRIVSGIACGLVVAISVLYFSMIVLLKLRGS